MSTLSRHLLSVSVALLCSYSIAGQEFAYPLTAPLQSRVPAAGLSADAYYLPGSSSVSCFEGTASGSRYLCLSDSGTILEWTSEGRIRPFASGFTTPIIAKAGDDGSLYVLELTRGVLSLVSREGTVTRLMGSGGDRVIRPQLDPKTFDLPYFTLSRDFYQNSVQMAVDRAGSLYVGIVREENTLDSGANVTKRFLWILRMDNKGSSLSLHFDGTANMAARSALPTFDALSVNAEKEIYLSLSGQLSRISSTGNYLDLRGGSYNRFSEQFDPVSNILDVGNGVVVLYSGLSGAIVRLAISPLNTQVTDVGTVTGSLTRQAENLMALDLNENRLLRFTPTAEAPFYSREIAANMLRYIPITGNTGFRAAFDNPISASVDNLQQVFVVEGEDGSVYRIAANGVVSRQAKTIFNPDNPGTYVFTSETVAMDAMPYPVIAVANNAQGRLFMMDRACNLFAQVDTNGARRIHKLSATVCREGYMVFDLGGRLNVALVAQGRVMSGTGDPVAGEWNFSEIFAGTGRIRSLSLMTSGDLLVVDGINSLKRVNPATRAMVRLRYDESLNSNVNLRVTSVATDFGGRILAVTCCTTGASSEAGRRYLFSFQLNSGDVLTGSARPVAYFDGLQQSPDFLIGHPRGVIIKTDQNRLYYLEDARFSSESGVSLPGRQTWTYTPNAGTQEIGMPVNPAYGPTAFRTRISCEGNFERFVRVGPSAAVAPTQLRLAFDSTAAPSRAASCRIELTTADGSRVMANTIVDLVPDPIKLAEIPTISVLEQFAPFAIDPAGPPVTRSLRVLNNAPDTVDVHIDANLPDGVTKVPASLSLEPKQSGEFTFTFDPAKLFRQHYQIPLRTDCSACAAPVHSSLTFQIAGRTTSIDITAESALIDIAALNARNANRWAGTSIVLQGLDESDVAIRTDFGTAPAWFSVQRNESVRTETGRLVLGYDVVLNREALPGRQTSNIVTFETRTAQGVARRFLTVFFFPEGSTAQRLFESGSAGSVVDMNTVRNATATIPVYSRSATAVAYSTYTLGGDSGTVSVPSAQGIVGRGTNEIVVELQRTGNPTSATEVKDVVILFSNGEKLLYTLNVLTASVRVTTQSKSGAREAIGACSSPRLLITPRDPGLPFAVVRNIGLRFRMELKDECNQFVNESDKAQVRFTTEPANGSVTVTSVGNGMWEAFWRPERTADNVAMKIVAVRGVSEREIYAGTLTLNGRVTDSAIPSLRSFNVVDAISYQQKTITAPGAFITIYGENLAEEPRTGGDVPGEYPVTLGGVQIQFNGKPAPLLYVSPNQINLQVPFDLSLAEYRMAITRGDISSAPAALGVGAASPAVFTTSGTGSGQGFVYRITPEGANFAAPGNAARAGETILILTAGLGPTNPLADEGKAVPGDEARSVVQTTQVIIGEVLASNVSAFLTPGQIGMYTVTAIVPAEAPKGDAVPVIVRASGVDSQVVTMAIE